MRALDLFCGGGGAALGMIQAGFDVVGVDKDPHPNYPGEFIQGDVFTDAPDLAEFDFVWASPPCQAFSSAFNSVRERKTVPGNLIPQTRELLSGHAFTCIENVIPAPIRSDLRLSGPMFGLNRIVRERKFELSFLVFQPSPVIRKFQCADFERIVVTKTLRAQRHWYPRKEHGLPGQVEAEEACEAMGITIPMTREEVGESIPPAFAQFIAERAKRRYNFV